MLTPEVLAIDAVAVADDIAARLHHLVVDVLKRRGIVVGLVGGVDASTTAGLAVNAFGRERVLAVATPDKEADPEALAVARGVAGALGITLVVEDLTETLRSCGAYARRDEAIRVAFPRYGEAWRSRVVLTNPLDDRGAPVPSVVATDPDGSFFVRRLSDAGYRQARASLRARRQARAMVEYYHADARHFAVAGSLTRIDWERDALTAAHALADVLPIAHLYKSQVYAVGRVVGVVDDGRTVFPAWDRYPLSRGEDDFYFSIPYEVMDLCLWAKDHGISVEDTVDGTGLRAAQVERIFADLEHTRPPAPRAGHET